MDSLGQSAKVILGAHVCRLGEELQILVRSSDLLADKHSKNIWNAFDASSYSETVSRIAKTRGLWNRSRDKSSQRISTATAREIREIVFIANLQSGRN